MKKIESDILYRKMVNQLALISIAFLLCLCSCSSENTDDELSGTTWMAKIDMEHTVLSADLKDNQYYYSLNFYDNNKFSIAIKDKNGINVQFLKEGSYTIKERELRLFIGKGEERNYYKPEKGEIYLPYYGSTFIRQN